MIHPRAGSLSEARRMVVNAREEVWLREFATVGAECCTSAGIQPIEPVRIARSGCRQDHSTGFAFLLDLFPCGCENADPRSSKPRCNPKDSPPSGLPGSIRRTPGDDRLASAGNPMPRAR